MLLNSEKRARNGAFVPGYKVGVDVRMGIVPALEIPSAPVGNDMPCLMSFCKTLTIYALLGY